MSPPPLSAIFPPMPTWLLFLLAVAAFWVLLALSLRALARRMRDRAHQAVARVARCEGALRTADAALHRLDPPDIFATGAAPQGALCLTPSRLVFQPWAAPAPLIIHRRELKSVGTEEGAPLRMLVVRWKAEGKVGEAVFLVADAEGWAAELQ